MYNRWKIIPKADEDKIAKLSAELKPTNPRLTNILIQRGIDTLKKPKITLDQIGVRFTTLFDERHGCCCRAIAKGYKAEEKIFDLWRL